MAGEQLLVAEGQERGKRLSVGAELLIGREAPGDEGRLGDDPELSRRHARVSRGAGGRLTIEDLGSANGTYVNGERLDAPRPLAAGDVVRVGRTVLHVAGGEPSRPAADAGEALVIVAGGEAGRRLAIGDELVIGREAGTEGSLGDDHEVSRRHARVIRGEDGRLAIEDLGSRNGTFVNGERVHGRRALNAGDSVRIGSTTMQLHGREPAAAAPPAAAPAAAPPKPPAPSAARRAAPVDALRRGTVLAGCRVAEVIGHGDMGVVYRAEELALRRPVALKLILPEHSSDARFRERFRRESLAAAAIDHPNVIPIYDAGDEDGVLYITMRLVEGTDLRALIDAQTRLEPLRAARIVRQVGAALDAAHARGMLHRDVKPSNVLLGREDHVYLSDFGLAKRAGDAGGLTRQGSIVGRAAYVAPEQILNERVDARTDIYALGCLLYESLTGEAPFARWTGGAAALAALDAPVPVPSAVCPGLPGELDEVVGRAMAKDPRDRYPSAGDVGQAALVAAGGQRRAAPWSVVATGDAAPADEEPAALAPSSGKAAPERTAGAGSVRLRWAVAIAGLVIVAVGMVAALRGISTL